MTYDAAGRVTLTHLPGHDVSGFPFAASRTVGFAYDRNGNTKQIVPPAVSGEAYASGPTWQPRHQFGYDAVNQLNELRRGRRREPAL